MKKIEEKDTQFLVEKRIHSIENKNPYMIAIEKNPRIILEFEKKYKSCRRVYKSLFIDVANTFIQWFILLTQMRYSN